MWQQVLCALTRILTIWPGKPPSALAINMRVVLWPWMAPMNYAQWLAISVKRFSASLQSETV